MHNQRSDGQYHLSAFHHHDQERRMEVADRDYYYPAASDPPPQMEEEEVEEPAFALDLRIDKASESISIFDDTNVLGSELSRAGPVFPNHARMTLNRNRTSAPYTVPQSSQRSYTSTITNEKSPRLTSELRYYRLQQNLFRKQIPLPSNNDAPSQPTSSLPPLPELEPITPWNSETTSQIASSSSVLRQRRGRIEEKAFEIYRNGETRVTTSQGWARSPRAPEPNNYAERSPMPSHCTVPGCLQCPPMPHPHRERSPSFGHNEERARSPQYIPPPLSYADSSSKYLPHHPHFQYRNRDVHPVIEIKDEPMSPFPPRSPSPPRAFDRSQDHFPQSSLEQLRDRSNHNESKSTFLHHVLERQRYYRNVNNHSRANDSPRLSTRSENVDGNVFEIDNKLQTSEEDIIGNFERLRNRSPSPRNLNLVRQMDAFINPHTVHSIQSSVHISMNMMDIDNKLKVLDKAKRVENSLRALERSSGHRHIFLKQRSGASSHIEPSNSSSYGGSANNANLNLRNPDQHRRAENGFRIFPGGSTMKSDSLLQASESYPLMPPRTEVDSDEMDIDKRLRNIENNVNVRLETNFRTYFRRSPSRNDMQEDPNEGTTRFMSNLMGLDHHQNNPDSIMGSSLCRSKSQACSYLRLDKTSDQVEELRAEPSKERLALLEARSPRDEVNKYSISRLTGLSPGNSPEEQMLILEHKKQLEDNFRAIFNRSPPRPDEDSTRQRDILLEPKSEEESSLQDLRHSETEQIHDVQNRLMRFQSRSPSPQNKYANGYHDYSPRPSTASPCNTNTNLPLNLSKAGTSNFSPKAEDSTENTYGQISPVEIIPPPDSPYGEIASNTSSPASIPKSPPLPSPQSPSWQQTTSSPLESEKSPEHENHVIAPAPSLPPPEIGKKGRRGRPRKHAPKIPLPPLYVFIRNLLHNSSYNPKIVSWINENFGVFKVNNTIEFAKTWGRMKSHRSEEMNYEKMSRAMRYHYGSPSRKGHLAMVKEKRLVYRFGELAVHWKSGEVEAKKCQIHELCKGCLCLWTKE